MTSLTEVEREAIVLQAVVESIQSMVNHEMLNFGSGTSEIQVTFKSSTRRALFNVLFADMLEPVDPLLLGVGGSLLDSVEAIPESPQLGSADDAKGLRAAVAELLQWLTAEVEIKVWFPSIEKDARIKLRRGDFISICGNVSKHNVSRLTRNAKRLSRLLGVNGISVEWVDALLALDDFQARFHDDIFSYHSTTMAELLTNLRWAIHEYLLAEFVRSYAPPVSDSASIYSYMVPDRIKNRFAQSRYWDLMNSVRKEPWIPRFTGTPNLKGDY